MMLERWAGSPILSLPFVYCEESKGFRERSVKIMLEALWKMGWREPGKWQGGWLLSTLLGRTRAATQPPSWEVRMGPG